MNEELAGAGGLVTRCADLRALAGLSATVSGDLLELAATTARALLDPDLLSSAVLDPGGAAAFEAALLDGVHDLTTVATDVGLRALQLRAAATAYEASDETGMALLDLDAFWDLADLGLELPWALAASLVADDPREPWERLLTEHPGAVDAVLSGTTLALSVASRGILPADVAVAAHVIGLLYPEGPPVVTETPFVGVTDQEPPRSLRDLLAGLDERSAAHPPQIDVRVVERALPDGTLERAFIVDIPGTTDWNPAIGPHPGELHDLPTNLHTMARDPTAHAAGIGAALRLAGASPTDPVMLVGHSQGGLVAMRASHDLVTSGEFDVTHVVTAGSPIGLMGVPPSVQLLSLENRYDLVPHLDAHDNRDAANRTTVEFSAQYGSIGENHSLRTAYLGAAAAVDDSEDPAVTTYRESAARFLNGDSVSSRAYLVTRTYP